MDQKSVGGLVIDDPQRCVFKVHRSTYTSGEIFELERERIFDRCWLYVGHESEITGPGDFKTREVGGRPLIFCRDSNGAIRVLINSCTHRGAQVCRAKEGNARSFQCFYHAWTFNNHGDLIGVPDQAGYGGAFDKTALGLKPPPRVTNYRGLVFASFDPEVEEFTDYLAGARRYLDLILDQAEQGMEIVAGEQAYSIRSNWKLLVENSADEYHVGSVHRSYIQYLQSTGVQPDKNFLSSGRTRALGNGHFVMISRPPWGRPIARWEPRWGEDARRELERTKRRLADRFGEERAAEITELDRNLLIFPNLVVNDIMAITLRTFHPVDPERMEVTAWALAPRGEAAHWRRFRLDSFLGFLGPGGLATPDDIEAIESCQRSFRALKEVEWSFFSRGMNREPIASDEEQQRSFWRKWAEQMAASPQARRSVGPPELRRYG